MSRVTVEPRAAVMLRTLRKLQGRIEDPTAILDEIGDLLRKTTVSRFYSKTGPTGRRWKPRKARGRAARKGSLLVRTGDLRDSIRAVVGDGKVEIGTDIWYGRLHQQGGRLDAKHRLRARYRGAGIGRIRVNAASVKKLARIADGQGTDAAVKAARETLAALGGRKRAARQRQVRIPARPFLGTSSRDRASARRISWSSG